VLWRELRGISAPNAEAVISSACEHAQRSNCIGDGSLPRYIGISRAAARPSVQVAAAVQRGEAAQCAKVSVHAAAWTCPCAGDEPPSCAERRRIAGAKITALSNSQQHEGVTSSGGIGLHDMPQERAASRPADGGSSSDTDPDEIAQTVRTVTRPLPRVLVVHTGGTLGMDPGVSYEIDASGKPVLAAGTGGTYAGGLKPGEPPL
jgi:hypothetical protein